MSETLDFESDQFLSLLTDALRAGPGSPQWHEAVALLRSGNAGSNAMRVDELKLLVAAREHLESGREYRSVRAGPEFSRKVLESIENEPSTAGRTFLSATALAIVSGIVALGVLVVVIVWLIPRGEAPAPGTERLASLVLVNTATASSFDGAPPEDWREIGRVPLAFSDGMKVSGPREAGSPSVVGGGIVWSTPLRAEEAFSVEATFDVPRNGDDIIPQIAVSDSSDFSADTASSSHELVWLVQWGTAKLVNPAGRIEAQSPRLDFRRSVTVRLTLDRDHVIAETAGKRLWAGVHGLDPTRPRSVALRFIRRDGPKQEPVVVRSVRIVKG
jgi:hypothetical protein